MDTQKIATEEQIQTAVTALEAHNFKPVVVANKEEALAIIKEMIPPGVSIMNGASRTLEQIGYIDYLKEGTHGWNNLHATILAEADAAKQADLRKHSIVSDFYLGSVHALSETGEVLIASNTGSQLPHLAFTSQNVILVVGAQKIVPTMEAAVKRLMEIVLPLEDDSMKNKYGVGTARNKTLILHAENPMMGRSVHVLIVKEALGF